MKVFLTGATGLLGINTVHQLLQHGHRVLALVRDPGKAARVLPASDALETVLGDMEAPNAWLPRIQEADAIIHCAAYFREAFGRGDHAAKLRAWNVELPARIATLASEYGVQKTMIVSSSGVVASRPDGKPTDETIPPQTHVPENAYFVSKQEMEAALSKRAPALKNTLLVVRPGWMFGPNDYAPTSAGQLVLNLMQQESLQMIGGSPTCIADARDVAAGMVAALEQAEGYEIYNLAGNPLSALQALQIIAQETGGKVQQIPLPAALLFSSLLEGITRFQNKPNPIPRIGLLTLSRGVLVSSDKAMRELGVAFRPFVDTARDTVAFFRNDYQNYYRESVRMA